VGHSLGGYLAENSGAHGNIATFNKASVGSKNKNSKQIDVRTKRDLVSMFTPKKKSNITIGSRSQNPLTEHTTDSLGRADEERVLFPQ
jgi:predicted dienelactone hydrolase